MRILITSLLLVVLFGCSAPEPGDNIIQLDPKTWPTKTVSLDDIIKEIQVLPLETKPECLITSFKPVRFIQDRMLLVQNNQILSFDKHGRFIRSFGNQGKGPGEYVTVSSLSLLYNENTSEIIVHDLNGRKYLYFKPNGDFIREIRSSHHSMKMSLINNEMIAVHAGRTGGGPERCELIMADWDGQIQKKYFPFRGLTGYDMCSGFARGTYPNSCLYHKMFDYTIYEVFPDRIDTLFIADFGSYFIDTSKFFVEDNDYYPGSDPDKIAGFNRIANTPEHLVAAIVMNCDIRGIFLLEHRSGKHTFLSADSAGCFGTFHGIPISIPTQNRDSWFVSGIDGIDWAEAIKSIPESEKASLRKKIPGFVEAEKVDENGNPILIFFKFREL